MKVVLTIGGSDSGGGAGIQADLKTFGAYGVYGLSVVTSITAQNTRGIRHIFNLPPTIIEGQIKAVFDDFPVDAIKVGMLGTLEAVKVLTTILPSLAGKIPVVFDPIISATSGEVLNAFATNRTEFEALLLMATLVTPNFPEAELISGSSADDGVNIDAIAGQLLLKGVKAVLIKGGHLQEMWDDDLGCEILTDVLVTQERTWKFKNRYIETRNLHGTGCTLSSAIAAGLALGMDLVNAIDAAEKFVAGAITHAPGLGGGSGPLHHGWQTHNPPISDQ